MVKNTVKDYQKFQARSEHRGIKQHVEFSQILPNAIAVRPNSRGFAGPPETNRPSSLVLPKPQPCSSLCPLHINNRLEKGNKLEFTANTFKKTDSQDTV